MNRLCCWIDTSHPVTLAEPLICGPIIPKKSQRIGVQLLHRQILQPQLDWFGKCVLRLGLPVDQQFNVKGSTHKTEQGVWYKRGCGLFNIGQRIEDIRLFFDDRSGWNKQDGMAE
ncbi:MAG: hypothetical protein ACKO4U_18070, partial [Caldilinea sp.]